jgi:toxin ParE1/3/4
MRRVTWSQPARHDLRNIIAYLAERNPVAAESVLRRLVDAVAALASLPTGRPGRVAGTYEKMVTNLPYIVAYEFVEEPDGSESIFILRIIHGARDWTGDRWREGKPP